jgi:hypothetical protein
LKHFCNFSVIFSARSAKLQFQIQILAVSWDFLLIFARFMPCFLQILQKSVALVLHFVENFFRKTAFSRL